MNCSACGAPVDGIYCGACGAQTPVAAPGSAPVKKKSNVAFIIVTIALALVVIGSSVTAVLMNSAAATHKKAATYALSQAAAENVKAKALNDLADTDDSLADTDEVYENNCYYNDYCTASTYQLWIDLVNSLRDKASEARTSASELTISAGVFSTTAAAEQVAQHRSELIRNIAFGGTGLGVAGLVTFLLVTRAKRKKAKA